MKMINKVNIFALIIFIKADKTIRISCIDNEEPTNSNCIFEKQLYSKINSNNPNTIQKCKDKYVTYIKTQTFIMMKEETKGLISKDNYNMPGLLGLIDKTFPDTVFKK